MGMLWAEFEDWALRNPFWGRIAHGFVNALVLFLLWVVIAFGSVSNGRPLPTQPVWLFLGGLIWVTLQFKVSAKFAGSNTAARESRESQRSQQGPPSQSGDGGADAQGGGAADGGD